MNQQKYDFFHHSTAENNMMGMNVNKSKHNRNTTYTNFQKDYKSTESISIT